jgi:hypothetical protein
MTRVLSSLGTIVFLVSAMVAGGASTGCGSSRPGGPTGTGGSAGTGGSTLTTGTAWRLVELGAARSFDYLPLVASTLHGPAPAAEK